MVNFTEVFEELAASLNEIEPIYKMHVWEVYPELKDHPDWQGLHYAYKASPLPSTLMEDEIEFLGQLIDRIEARNILIIGNGMGLSTAFIGWVAKPGKVTVVENKSVGKGDLCFETSMTFFAKEKLTNISLIDGASPEAIPKFRKKLDLVFIDGDHGWPAPLKDWQEVKKYITEDTVILWHDYHIKGVSRSLAKAVAEDGLFYRELHTSGRMVISSLSKARLEELE